MPTTRGFTLSTATVEPIVSHMGKNKDRSADRHKPRRMVGIPHRVAIALEAIGKNREATLSEMVKVACIAYLESQGVWPPNGGKRH